MNQSIREQAAGEGSDAVLILDKGTQSDGNDLWAQGKSIHYDAAPLQQQLVY